MIIDLYGPSNSLIDKQLKKIIENDCNEFDECFEKQFDLLMTKINLPV